MTRIRTLALATLAIATCLSGAASAQKLYRWVDKDGKVHISDQLPPEAVNQARQEFNARGNAVATVDRALTAEERLRLEAEREAAAKEAAQAEELRRIEECMLVNYETEDQLKRAYEERITVVKTNAEATEVSIRSQKAALVAMLADASESELSGRTVAEDRANIIRQMHAEIVKLQALQVRQAASQMAVDQEFARVLARYRELKGLPDPASTGPEAATTPAPAATPAK